MLTDKEKSEIKEALLKSERPLFFFHDDADGVASFLQFYKQVERGKGVIVKSTPCVNEKFSATVNNYGPDVIFILDLALVEQDFVDQVNVPIYWIDHHDIANIKGVHYYNPKKNKEGDNTCIAKLSYDIFQDNFWIAAFGTVGDWQLPNDIREKLNKDLPELFNKKIKTPQDALFDSKIGKLAKIINFVLKGQMKEVHQAIKILTRINDPNELLEESSEQGKYLMKKFKSINNEYERLLKEGISKASNDKLLVFTYAENKVSLSGELSNELLYRYPDKIIIIARHHDGEMKTSFRSSGKIKVKYVIEKALKGINGRAGGHDYACGGLIKDTDWDQFIKNMRESI